MSSGGAHAASRFGRRAAYALSVIPARTEVRLSPGAEAHAIITISNETNAVVHVTVSEKDWFVLPENSSWTVKTWLTVKAPAHLDLKAGARREIPIELKCPASAQGDLVGMVSFRYEGDVPTMVTPMISVSVYMTAAGTERLSGEIEEVQAYHPATGISVGALFKNTGNVHLRPSGTIMVQGGQGQLIAQYRINENDPVYPGRVKACTVQDSNISFEPGRYKALIDLVYKETHWRAQRGFKVLKDGKIEMDSEKKGK